MIIVVQYFKISLSRQLHYYRTYSNHVFLLLKLLLYYTIYYNRYLFMSFKFNNINIPFYCLLKLVKELFNIVTIKLGINKLLGFIQILVLFLFFIIKTSIVCWQYLLRMSQVVWRWGMKIEDTDAKTYYFFIFSNE